MISSEHLGSVFLDVETELKRQIALKEFGKFSFTCADDIDENLKLTILVEEIGEIARAIHDDDSENLVEELTQVAAIATAWLIGLKERKSV